VENPGAVDELAREKSVVTNACREQLSWTASFHAQTRIQNLEARNRSKIAAFAPHFSQLDKNIDAKSKFDVNKMIELAHIFFVIEMIRSDSRGRENYG
jgi:hypothetical protein